MKMKSIYINGEWKDAITTDFIKVENPVNHEILAHVPACGETEVKQAVDAAYEAFMNWSQLSVEERCDYIKEFKRQLEAIYEEIVATLKSELGVNDKYGRGAHVDGHISHIENYLQIAKAHPLEMRDGDMILRQEPYGVVACLTPWNYPMGQIMSKIVPALLAGNTVVLKPSQQTPLTAYHIMEAIHAANFPKGVINMVPGRGREVGNALATHPKVALVSFTGSTQGGREVYELAAKSIKKVVLELGGKSAAIVWDSAYYGQAVKSVLSTVYNNVGQTCSAWTRLFVPRKDLAEVEAIAKEVTAKFQFGDPQSGPYVIGPLASRKQFDKVTAYIAEGVKEGARLVIGQTHEGYRGSYMVGPTVFSDVRNDMKISQEEIFGPVLCIIPFESLEEAIAMANDNPYGLSGAVFGEKDKAIEVARQLRTGEVSINGHYTSQPSPFGGFKQSGIGREGGQFGYGEFLQWKVIHV